MIFWGLNWLAIRGKNIPQYCKIDMQLFCSGLYINLEKTSLWRSMTEVTAFPPKEKKKKRKKVVLRNWWERFMMSRGFKLNVKLNRKIENSCLLTNLLQSQPWLLWRHSCGHWHYPGCCGYFRCHSLFPLQPADPAPCHFLRAGGERMLHSKLAEVLLSSNCRWKTVCLCTNVCVIYSWLLWNLEILSYRPHHAHHAVLLPQHFPLPVPPGHHDGLPHLLLLPQLQPKQKNWQWY